MLKKLDEMLEKQCFEEKTLSSFLKATFTMLDVANCPGGSRVSGLISAQKNLVLSYIFVQ